MRRRVVRLRKEYLFQKQRDATNEAIQDSKQALRSALDSHTQIPERLKKNAAKLKNSVELEDDQTKTAHTQEDDEYALAGMEDPSILLTTSHDPSQKLLQFVKEVKLLFPNSTRLNRGSLGVNEMFEVARANNFTDVVVVGETRGEPDSLVISHLPFGPSIRFTLFNTVMRHDIEGVLPLSEQYPHLIFDNFVTKLGKRVETILKYLFPVPKEDATRVLTFSNENDFVRFRHHTFVKRGREVVLTEIGPRFEMRPYEIRQGTLEMKDAESEWKLAAFQNTAKKRKLL
eukprot:PhM_4_TR14372/c0_g1_i1/m.98108/K14561/IMP4; U3 small nucleolar ribonucleoprotein protein IMP4